MARAWMRSARKVSGEGRDNDVGKGGAMNNARAKVKYSKERVESAVYNKKKLWS
jgi:hypothetical protein